MSSTANGNQDRPAGGTESKADQVPALVDDVVAAALGRRPLPRLGTIGGILTAAVALAIIAGLH